MINPEDYPTIEKAQEGKYVSQRELQYIQSCFDKEQKAKEEGNLNPLLNVNPDIINQKRKELIEIFSYFDTDNTGIINISDIRQVMNILGQTEKSHVDTLLNMAEIEGDGYMNYRDFVYYIIK